MNKRQRKKWLKQHNKYIPYKELWSLDMAIAHYVHPRLKLFKRLNIGYPTYLSAEEWDEILDKMIFSFEEIKKDCMGCEISFDDPDWKNKVVEYDSKIQEGLELFGKHFRDLWW